MSNRLLFTLNIIVALITASLLVITLNRPESAAAQLPGPPAA